MSLEYVNKNKLKAWKTKFYNAVKELKKTLPYKFNYYLVESSSRNLILAEKDGKFDMDYQLHFNYDDNINCEHLKKELFDLFQRYFKKEDNWNCDDSTSAITIKKIKNDTKKDFIFNYDVVIWALCNLSRPIIL
ncbi:hypothetical protein [Spiroplasma turonicum]|nr:hypothetical protein [Spiroplasma turonicum]